MFPRMPLVDPVLVLADRGADDETTAHAVRELCAAARRIGTPVTVARPYPGPYSAGTQLADLVGLVRATAPRAVLIAADRAGEELAARLAVGLEAGIVTDVTGLCLEGGSLFVVQEIADGTCRVATEVRGATPVITVRRGAFPAEDRRLGWDAAFLELCDALPGPGPGPGADHGQAPDQATRPDARPRTRVLSRRAKREAGGDVLLDEADVVVAGGRGVGSAEGFGLLARLAQVLGGCLGGTHTAGELGWCPEHARISLPGVQIRPRLYLAGGVSGSVRHRAAIRRARTVVAIDRDPAAPIFRDADFGVVGDLHEVLPALLEELARRPRRGSAVRVPPTAAPASAHPPTAHVSTEVSAHVSRPDPSELAEA
jgi:electron transfer flavoprotein alpha subunit